MQQSLPFLNNKNIDYSMPMVMGALRCMRRNLKHNQFIITLTMQRPLIDVRCRQGFALKDILDITNTGKTHCATQNKSAS